MKGFQVTMLLRLIFRPTFISFNDRIYILKVKPGMIYLAKLGKNCSDGIYVSLLSFVAFKVIHISSYMVEGL